MSSSPAAPFLEFARISKRFGAVTALDSVTCAIGSGEFFTILGPSGCGKTTLLRVAAGLALPDEGEIRIGGEPVNRVPPYQRNLGMVFQHYALFPHLSVERNVAYGLERRGMPRGELVERVREALTLVQLDADVFAGRRPTELSGGQRQRVALARALITQPALLLLDEPLGALDLALRKAMQLELRQLNRRLGITFVYVTHDQDEALGMSDRIAVMERGRVVQVGSPRELYEHPRTAFVAGFIGESNFLTDPLGRRVMVRPERVSLFGPTAIPSPGGLLRGTVEACTYLGDRTAVAVALTDGSRVTASLPHRLHGSEPPIWRPGDEVLVGWRPEDAMLLENA